MVHPSKQLAAVIAAGLLIWCAYLDAQQVKPSGNGDPQPVAEERGAVFRADTRVVDLPVTVMDKTGHLVTNLPKNAFTVYENA